MNAFLFHELIKLFLSHHGSGAIGTNTYLVSPRKLIFFNERIYFEPCSGILQTLYEQARSNGGAFGGRSPQISFVPHKISCSQKNLF